MKIFVKARTRAKVNRVEAPQPRLISEDKEWYVVRTKAEPVEGRANKSIILLLAEHFGVSRSQVMLVSGATSKQKVFDIRL